MSPNVDPQLVKKLHLLVRQANARAKKASDKLDKFIEDCENQPRSVTEELDSIPGRRVPYFLSGVQDFTPELNGLRGQAINFNVSQDGPFIMTFHPLVAWRPNSPVGATNFGQWSPVASWPLPLQQSVDQDRIDLSFEMNDGGSQRDFQNIAAAPFFSRPDNAIPLAVPSVFSPATVIQFIPTYEDIFFDPDSVTPTEGGRLVVTLVGYKIANL